MLAGEPKQYITSWPSGHFLSEVLYIFVSIGSVTLGWNVTV